MTGFTYGYFGVPIPQNLTIDHVFGSGWRNGRKSVVNKRGYVYFARNGKDGPIKIGKAKDPRKRIAGLQTSSPFTLVPLLLVCDQDFERILHRRFLGFRVRGEWFNPSDYLLGYISNATRSAWGSMDIRGVDVPIAEYSEYDLPENYSAKSG
jgi:T5orf172 domain